MFELSVQSYFAAAHRLKHYQGKCEALHGHNWKVEVTVQALELNAIGLAIDFKDLKEMLNEALAPLDHTCLNDIPPFNDINPSSENIAKFIYEVLKKKLPGQPVTLTRVSVWESENSWAAYYEK
jgi:6-pyruvoyltetrahydropterin/6-carboxytetrahydropterin synthase